MRMLKLQTATSFIKTATVICSGYLGRNYIAPRDLSKIALIFISPSVKTCLFILCPDLKSFQACNPEYFLNKEKKNHEEEKEKWWKIFDT